MAQAVRFSGQLQAIKSDSKYLKRFKDKAETLTREAAREWLRAVIVHVPVWTGFAKGSIAFARGPGGLLAQYLNVSVPIDPISPLPIWYYHSDGRKIRKLTEKASPFGRYNFTSSNNVYRFSFRSDVVHFIINEFFSSHSPTSPWESMLAGRFAYMQHMKNNFHKLPKLESAFIKVPLPVA